MNAKNGNYAISGHETFAFRFAWLPKAVEIVQENAAAFDDEDDAMVRLGVGKNMVRSIRFWSQATGIIAPNPKGGHTVSPLGLTVLDQACGLDPYLEDDQTLWLLHWQLSTAGKPLLAWHFLLNQWHEPELIASAIVSAAASELDRQGRKTSESSLRSHFAAFFHTYCPSRGTKPALQEATLDCPLTQLQFVERSGDRVSVNGKREDVYSFRRSRKPEVSDSLFAYCLFEFWAKSAPNEVTLSFREIASGGSSPGSVFKMPDEELRERLERVGEASHGIITYSESALIQAVHRECEFNTATRQRLLKRIYR